MNRTPPESVRETLRKEVHFGCPICGSPYLEYHHFDPSWHESEHHNPQGMIALCRDHHPVADSGAWTKEQLREIKNNPFIKDELIGNFNWFRQDILIMAGVIIQNPQVILEIRNEKVVWMQKDSNGYFRLNMIIRDSEGTPVLQIIENDWVVHNDRVIDIVCPPSGKELSLMSKDHKTNLAIRFDDVSLNEFKVRLDSIWDQMIKVREREYHEFNQKRAANLDEYLTKDGVSQNEKQKIIEQFLANTVRYDSQSPEQEKEQYIERIVRKIGNPERVTTCTLKASLDYQGIKFEIDENGFSSNPITIRSGFFMGCRTAYSFDEHSMSFGKS